MLFEENRYLSGSLEVVGVDNVGLTEKGLIPWETSSHDLKDLRPLTSETKREPETPEKGKKKNKEAGEQRREQRMKNE